MFKKIYIIVSTCAFFSNLESSGYHNGQSDHPNTLPLTSIKKHREMRSAPLIIPSPLKSRDTLFCHNPYPPIQLNLFTEPPVVSRPLITQSTLIPQARVVPKEEIEQLHNTIVQAVQHGNFQELFRLRNENSIVFSLAMKAGAGVQTLSFLLKQFSNPQSQPGLHLWSTQQRAEILSNLVEMIPSSQFIKRNANGQTLVHELIPWCYNKKIMQQLAEKTMLDKQNVKKTVLDVQTIHPDRFEGTTIAHAIAYFLRKKQENYERYKHSYLEVHIQNDQDFIVWWIEKCLDSVFLKSKEANKRERTVWSFLTREDRKIIYDRLKPETILGILQGLQEKCNAGLITLDDYNTFITQIPLKK
jgi:hypothetical protein